jgi:hypothetical protein
LTGHVLATANHGSAPSPKPGSGALSRSRGPTLLVQRDAEATNATAAGSTAPGNHLKGGQKVDISTLRWAFKHCVRRRERAFSRTLHRPNPEFAGGMFGTQSGYLIESAGTHMESGHTEYQSKIAT